MSKDCKTCIYYKEETNYIKGRRVIEEICIFTPKKKNETQKYKYCGCMCYKESKAK